MSRLFVSIQPLFRATAAYEDLKARYDRLEGELAMRKRDQHGRKTMD